MVETLRKTEGGGHATVKQNKKIYNKQALERTLEYCDNEHCDFMWLRFAALITQIL